MDLDLHPDFLDLLRSFVEANVEFVVVGGFAVAVHAEPRFTANIDLFVRPSAPNARRVRLALDNFGFAGVQWADDEFSGLIALSCWDANHSASTF